MIVAHSKALVPCTVAARVACKSRARAAGCHLGSRPVRTAAVLQAALGVRFGSIALAARVRPLVRSPLQVRAELSNGASNGSGPDYDFDLFTIGAGSGGVRASRVAAATYGARVAVCEMPFNPIASDTEGGAGGTCVLRGCVPKKLFVYCSSFNEALRDAEGFGWQLPGGGSGSAKIDWTSFLAKKNAELARLNGVYNNMLKNSGVTFIQGRGSIVDAHTVEVDGKRYTAKNILIATGGRASVPPNLEGSEHCIISDQALELPQLPKSIAIVGGGYIAVEFAGIFARMGVETHVVYRQPLPLRGFDEEVREFVAEQYVEAGGLQLHPSCTPIKVEKGGAAGMILHLDTKDGQPKVLEVETVMLATGRHPNTKNLGLDKVGVELNKAAIAVDEYSRTSVPSIFAVGDVTDRMNLTPVALMEGTALCKTLFGGEPTAPDYDSIPTAVFSHPEMATVGLTEEEAAEQYGDIDVFTSKFRPMKNTISGNPGRSFMKIIVDTASQKVLGFHSVGPDSAEIMQGMALAVKYGLTKQQLDGVVGIHPSSAEEFVTMRTVTREVRNKVPAKAA